MFFRLRQISAVAHDQTNPDSVLKKIDLLLCTKAGEICVLEAEVWKIGASLDPDLFEQTLYCKSVVLFWFYCCSIKNFQWAAF